ncbi:MAG TPA: EF-hand domain-containing protein [Phycisphaerae bacterium]|nr:EF-hand domain-containing protein [Phycisphaerae bacterium]HOM52420.1 EF-hand domain-containing protein [Phycisphaerae bacterium]HPP27694.1 EF-hand domain-containing protein [Phycisphaerae bacterium]
MRGIDWALAAAAVVVSSQLANGQIFQEKFDSYSGMWLSLSSDGVWVTDGCRDGKLSADPSDVWSAPLSVVDHKDGTTNKRVTFRNRHYLTTAELLNAGVVQGDAPNCVDGTDANPLTLDFYLYLGPNSSLHYRKNAYIEIACGSDRAPTPTEEVTCADGNVYPHLKLDGDGTVHRAIAVGQIAMADTDPCDDAGEFVQRNWRLSVYDGRRWHFFTANELRTCPKYNFVRLVIKSTTIEVTIHNKWDGTGCDGSWNTRTVTLDRRYIGPFTSLAMGGVPNEEGGECWDQSNLPKYPDSPAGFDDIELSGGVATHFPGVCEDLGACCMGDTCSQATPTACAAIEGAIFAGLGTVCGVAEGRCCADPMVDSDRDGDVDMVDFAKFQRCLTVGAVVPEIPFSCACFDTDGDGDIDEYDFANFAGTDVTAGCVSGPGIPADPSCDDNW